MEPGPEGKGLPWPGAIAALVGAAALGLAVGRWPATGPQASPRPPSPSPTQDPAGPAAVVLGPEGATRLDPSLPPSPRPRSATPSPHPKGGTSSSAQGPGLPASPPTPRPPGQGVAPLAKPSGSGHTGPAVGASPRPEGQGGRPPGQHPPLRGPTPGTPHPHWAHPRPHPPSPERTQGPTTSSPPRPASALGRAVSSGASPKRAMPGWPQGAPWHEVQAGESLWAIAEAHSGSGLQWRQWWVANRDAVANPHRLAVGQRLRLPEQPSARPGGEGREILVRPGDTLSHLAWRHAHRAQAWPALWAANQDRVPNPHWIHPGQRLRLPWGPSQGGGWARPGTRRGAWVWVQPGDTLWAIAKRSYGTGLAWRRIQALNRKRLGAPEALRPGLLLRVR